MLKDGRKVYTRDEEIENSLSALIGGSAVDAVRNFPVYARRVWLKRFLAHYTLFQQVKDLPGDIVELGVYKGFSLMSWANFLEIHNMGDRHKKVIGFDNFKGFTGVHPKDGAPDASVDKKIGGFSPKSYETTLLHAIAAFDQDRFIPYKKRVEVVKGNIEDAVPAYIKANPGIRISLLHFDCDMYMPTMAGLKYLWPLVVPGGIVAFDEYGIPPWEGESAAVDEFFYGQNVKLRRFDWCANPGAYLVKGET